ISSVSSRTHMTQRPPFFFFLNAPPPTDIYTLSLHDALPIYSAAKAGVHGFVRDVALELAEYGITVNAVAPGPIDTERFGPGRHRDRKSTRLNSSHDQISYAVFCLKKKKDDQPIQHYNVNIAV